MMLNKKTSGDEIIQSSNDKALKKEPNDSPNIFANRKQLLKILIPNLVLLIIVAIVLIIGHFQFG